MQYPTDSRAHALARQEAQRAYRTEGYGTCPFCHSARLTLGPVEIPFGAGAYQEKTCATCGAHWTDVYRLVGYMRPASPLEDVQDIDDSVEND